MTTKVAAHEGEVGKVVLVADLLHRLLGVLEGCLQLEYQHVVDDFLGSAPVIHAAYAPEILRTDMQLFGIEVHSMHRLAMLVEQ